MTNIKLDNTNLMLVFEDKNVYNLDKILKSSFRDVNSALVIELSEDKKILTKVIERMKTDIRNEIELAITDAKIYNKIVSDIQTVYSNYSFLLSKTSLRVNEIAATKVEQFLNTELNGNFTFKVSISGAKLIISYAYKSQSYFDLKIIEYYRLYFSDYQFKITDRPPEISTTMLPDKVITDDYDKYLIRENCNDTENLENSCSCAPVDYNRPIIHWINGSEDPGSDEHSIWDAFNSLNEIVNSKLHNFNERLTFKVEAYSRLLETDMLRSRKITTDSLNVNKITADYIESNSLNINTNKIIIRNPNNLPLSSGESAGLIIKNYDSENDVGILFVSGNPLNVRIGKLKRDSEYNTEETLKIAVIDDKSVEGKQVLYYDLDTGLLTEDPDLNIHILHECLKNNKAISTSEGFQNSLIFGNINENRVRGNFAEAHGTGTVANSENQVVFGTYNVENSDALFIIANGDSVDSKNNVFTVTKDGLAYLNYSISEVVDDKTVINKEYLDERLKNMFSEGSTFYDELKKIIRDEISAQATNIEETPSTQDIEDDENIE